ncbi:MAG TPA: thioesterase family protein [Polyangia bacterium]|nr:thioesterase family protein [Polyangia bacterium]
MSSPALAASSSAPALREVARTRVIYGDTDQMGMVYYANYLRYFEIARNEYLRVAGATYRAFEETHGLMLPVVEAHVTYRRPARYDDELAISAAVIARGAASVRFEYEIHRVATATTPGEKLVSGYTIHACITREGRVTRLPDELRAAVGLPASSTGGGP